MADNSDIDFSGKFQKLKPIADRMDNKTRKGNVRTAETFDSPDRKNFNFRGFGGSGAQPLWRYGGISSASSIVQ